MDDFHIRNRSLVDLFRLLLLHMRSAISLFRRVSTLNSVALPSVVCVRIIKHAFNPLSVGKAGRYYAHSFRFF